MAPMMLDVFEGSVQGKWLGLFASDEPEPPKPRKTIYLKSWRGVSWKVKSCVQQRHNGQPVNSYLVIVKKK
jgi:hypothetical protein